MSLLLESTPSYERLRNLQSLSVCRAVYCGQDNAMPQRTFLPWSRPLLPAVVDHLCAGWTGGMLDLSALVVIVPTAEAGRRLRAALAMRASAKGAAVLSPLIITPELITS